MPSGKARPNASLNKHIDIELMAHLLDKAGDSILLHDLKGNFVYFNEAAFRLRGYSKDEFQNLHLKDLPSPEQVGLVKTRMAEIIKNGETVFTSDQKGKDGSLIHVEVHSRIITWKGQKYVLSLTRDITPRKRAEEALNEILQRQELVLNSLPVVFYTADTSPQMATTWINTHIKDLSGYTPEDFINDAFFWQDRIHPDDRERALKQYNTILINDFAGAEYRWLCADGLYHWFIDRIVLLRDSQSRPKEIMGVWIDITERKRAEEKIQASLQEKEVLLKEIHHRVKNNMQIISSLINLQSRQLTDEKAIEMFKESQDRIRSMAIVHEKLYQSKSFSEIDFSEYIERLVYHHFHAYGVNANQIKMSIQADPISLDINAAIPAGLILNELVSNSLKHAFPKGKSGEIRIDFRRLEGNKVLLTVADTGIGFPKDLDILNTGSLGMQIVIMLADQLEARMELQREGRTTFTFVFEGHKDKKEI